MKLNTFAAVTGALVMSGLAVAQTPTPRVPPSSSDTPAPSSPSTTQTQAVATPAPSAMGTSGLAFVQNQRPTELLASKTVGSSVYNSTKEKIGTVSDIVVDGASIQAVIVGVGGFLRPGREAVIPKSIRMSPDERGNPKIVLDATREQLTNAPAYTFHKPG